MVLVKFLFANMIIVSKFPGTFKTNVEVKATQSAIPSAIEGGVFDRLRSFPRLTSVSDVLLISPVYASTGMILTTKAEYCGTGTKRLQCSVNSKQ